MSLSRQEDNNTLHLGPVIGTYKQQPIHAWFIDGRGQTHDYIGTFTGFKELGDEDSLVEPGLIYQRRRTGRTQH
jgi:hypothetical protein